jgi:hypothetical protein
VTGSNKRQLPRYASAVNACLPRVEVTAPNVTLRILYLQPVSTAPDEVGFDEIATWLDRQDDPVAERFAASLRDWSQVIAGRQTPGGA